MNEKIFTKIIPILIVLAFFLPFFINAQTDLSSESSTSDTKVSQEPSTGTVADPTPSPEPGASATVLDPALAPASNVIIPTRPVPKTDTPIVPKPAPPSSVLDAQMSPIPDPIIQNPQTSKSYIPIALAILAAGLCAGIFFGLNSIKKAKQDKKKENSKCLNIKKLMEKKLNELTDLKGQLANLAKGEASKQVKNMVKGTQAENFLNLIENANKEYGRLKELYEKCITDLGENKNKHISYLMGTDNIKEDEIKNLGVKIEDKNENGHFMLMIPEKSLSKYIELVKTKLTKGFWNEIISEKEILFLFKFNDEHIEEYKLSLENERIINKLCSEFNKEPPEKTKNVYKYLSENNFYHDFMTEHYKDKINR